AHRARQKPCGPLGTGVDKFSLYAFQHKRCARRALAAYTRMWPVFQCSTGHDDRPFPRDVQGRRAATRNRGTDSGSGRLPGYRRFRFQGGLVKHEAAEPVGRVDRARPVQFTFDGRTLTGFRGDTLASALLRNGVHLVGRSFKYHRPRGILSAGAEEPNALVTLERGPDRVTPNLRATQIELYDGLVASSQNRWPSLTFDLGAVNDLFSPLFGAGFYYKTFMGPNWAW